MRFRDDGVRIVVELFSTASVLAALGEFPFPDETERLSTTGGQGDDDDPPDVA